MKKMTLILISLFVLVIGISCASAADLNSHSVAADGVADAHLGSGHHREQLGSLPPQYLPAKSEAQLSSAGNLESGIGGGGSEAKPFYATLGSGIGGGGSEAKPFYATLGSGIGGGGSEAKPFY